MKKVTGHRLRGRSDSRSYRLQVTVITGLILTFLLPVAYRLSPAYAADSTPSADPLRQSDSEASIRAKLEELKKEIASKAAKLKQEIGRKLKDKAYVGKVKLKSPQSLTLAAESGPKIVSINQDTIFESKIKRKVKFSQKSLTEEDDIAALGDTDETGVLTAKKIILLPPPPETQKTYLWGQIIAVSERLVTLKTNDSKNVAAVLSPGSKVLLNDFVILTGTKDKNEVFNLKFVYVIPPGVSLKPKKASPSAQTATSSGKIKPKKAN